MNQQNCPVCGEGHLSEQTAKNTVTYKGETIELDSLFAICDVCGIEQADSNHLLTNKRKMVAFKKQVEGLLTGSEVRAIRHRLNITQSKAAEIFGGGPVAFSKYEKDDVMQAESMDNLLRMASTLEGFRNLQRIVEAKAKNPQHNNNLGDITVARWETIRIVKVKRPVEGKQLKVFHIDQGNDWADLRMCAGW